MTRRTPEERLKDMKTKQEQLSNRIKALDARLNAKSRAERTHAMVLGGLLLDAAIRAKAVDLKALAEMVKAVFPKEKDRNIILDRLRELHAELNPKPAPAEPTGDAQ